jgi:hypothetical protein
VIARHGPAGPWPADELAVIAEHNADSVRRVLDQMVTEGLATPPADETPEAPQA